MPDGRPETLLARRDEHLVSDRRLNNPGQVSNKGPHGELDMPDGAAACPEFVALGHVTFDVRLPPGGAHDRPEPGGTAAYAAETAIAMGRAAGIVTSSSPGYPFDTLLPSTDMVNVPAAATTTFEYSLHDGVRTQWLRARAAELTRSDVPGSWLGAQVVLLGPVAYELPRHAADWFSDDSFVCAVPQGWQRSRDVSGKVVVSPAVPSGLSTRIDAAVISETDVPAEHVDKWAQTFRIVAVTRGRRGARVYVNGQGRDIPPVAANEVDATGAGDVWAAAFAINLAETRDIAFAANFATAAAAMSIEHRGMQGIPARNAVTARMRTSQ